MIDRLIAESTDCDFKVALEVKKPKSWLKSVSAFANGVGGTLIFGVDNKRNIIGLSDAQADAENISRLIKDRITPYPNFVLRAEYYDGKNILILSIFAGHNTPYYYKADGIMEAYIRLGNETVIAPSYVVNQLIIKGINRTYDSLDSEYYFKDYAFSTLRERYKVWTGNSLDENMFDSFEIRNSDGLLTNAGALLADYSPLRHSRVFCTRWDGLDKSGGIVDAIDSAEYSGSLILLLKEGVSFVKRNMKVRWKKTNDSRIEMPDYCERSVLEALVNALIHRDYLILGSEVHIDIYDDRLTITSPGGMADGTRIQDRDIYNISSTRRNPILADIFGRLGYMERQGSGFKKITDSYRSAYNYREELKPEFYSDSSIFQVTLHNLNYNSDGIMVIGENIKQFRLEKVALDDKKVALDEKKVALDEKKVALDEKKVAFMGIISKLNINTPTKNSILSLFEKFGYDLPFSRSDVIKLCSLAPSSAGKMLSKIKDLELIVPFNEDKRGKYVFKKKNE